MSFQQAVGRYFLAIEKRDLTSFKEIVKKDASVALIFPNGHLIQGYDAIIDFHRDWFLDMDWKMNTDILQMTETGNTGLVLSKVQYEDVDQTGTPFIMDYYLNLVFAKLENEWLLVHDQNTLIQK